MGLLPDLGKAPAVTALGPTAASAATSLAVAYNAALEADLSGLTTAGANIFFLDAFSLMDAAIVDPSAFGLSNVTDPCYGGPLTGGGTVCATPDQYLFWDDEHPASAAGPFLAAAAADALGVRGTGTATLLAVGFVGLAACRGAKIAPSAGKESRCRQRL